MGILSRSRPVRFSHILATFVGAIFRLILSHDSQSQLKTTQSRIPPVILGSLLETPALWHETILFKNTTYGARETNQIGTDPHFKV